VSEFKIGELALLVINPSRNVFTPSDASRYFGTIVEVISAPRLTPRCNAIAYTGGYGYDIRTHDGFETDVGVVCLKKLEPPPPKREELGSWDLCPWQPMRSYLLSFGYRRERQ
jgi:hypothetical protein